MKSKWIRTIIFLTLLLMMALANLAAGTTGNKAIISGEMMAQSPLEACAPGSACCAQRLSDACPLGTQVLLRGIDSGKVKPRTIEEQAYQVSAQSIKVDCFFEDNDAWRCDQLGFNPLTTIGTWPGKYRSGCTLTSVAMIVRYFGVDTDPGKLNQWLKDNGGFVPGTAHMYPCAVTRLDGVDSCQQFYSKNVDVLKSELDAGRPVLLGLWNGTKTYHWVVATGYSGNTMFYNDPAFSPCDGRTLDASADTFRQMVIYNGNMPPPPLDTTPPSIHPLSLLQM
jgi:hypothetical protein